MLTRLRQRLTAKRLIQRAFCNECGGTIQRRWPDDTCCRECADAYWARMQT